MTRWKAAFLHLLASAAAIGAVAVLLIGVWYDGWELFLATGGRKLLTVLAATMVAIGPLLTLLVYKPGKKSLKFDLTVIALLQAGFLAYGLNVMRASRPIFLVGVVDRFELVFANELADEDLERATRPEYRSKSLSGPRLVGALLAQNSQETLDLALSGFAGRDVHLMPERYVDYADSAPMLATRAQPVSLLIGSSVKADAERLERAVQALGRAEPEIAYVPIVSRYGRATMLLSAATGEVLAPVAVDPWPDAPASDPTRQ